MKKRWKCRMKGLFVPLAKKKWEWQWKEQTHRQFSLLDDTNRMLGDLEVDVQQKHNFTSESGQYGST